MLSSLVSNVLDKEENADEKLVDADIGIVSQKVASDVEDEDEEDGEIGPLKSDIGYLRTGNRPKGMSVYQLPDAPSLEDDDEIASIAVNEIERVVTESIAELALREDILFKATAGVMTECLKTCVGYK